MDQFQSGQERVKALVTFDGAIDGEPDFLQIGVDGATVTAEPKIYFPPDASDPLFPNGKTTVVAHHANPGANVGPVSVAVKAQADLPGTPTKEEINGVYGFEWIAAGQPKATSLTVGLESEPV